MTQVGNCYIISHLSVSYSLYMTLPGSTPKKWPETSTVNKCFQIAWVLNLPYDLPQSSNIATLAVSQLTLYRFSVYICVILGYCSIGGAICVRV